MRRLTPKGHSAIAVLRIEPAEREAALHALAVSQTLPRDRPSLRRLELGAGVEEDALLVPRMDGSLELHLHGNPALLELCIERLSGRGLRESDAATQRSACLDREAQSEGRDGSGSGLVDEILELAQKASSRTAVASCLFQAGDRGLVGCLRRWRAALATGGSPSSFAAELDHVLANGAASRPFLVPPRVVLCGPSNAGKSTLFNLLLERERVRTGPELGLTRDSIEESWIVDGLELRLVDTAGVIAEPGLSGASADPLAIEVDRGAQWLAEQERARAQLLLHLEPCPGGSTVKGPWFRVHSHAAQKKDCCEDPSALHVELVHDAETARRRLRKALRAAFGGACPGLVEPAWISERQHGLLLALHASIRTRGEAASLHARRLRFLDALGDGQSRFDML